MAAVRFRDAGCEQLEVQRRRSIPNRPQYMDDGCHGLFEGSERGQVQHCPTPGCDQQALAFLGLEGLRIDEVPPHPRP